MCGCFFIIGLITFMIYSFASGNIPLGAILLTVLIVIFFSGGAKNQTDQEKAEKEKAAQEALAKQQAAKEKAAKEAAEKERLAKEKMKQEKKAKEAAKDAFPKERPVIEMKEQKVKQPEDKKTQTTKTTVANKSKQRFCTNCGKPLPSDFTASFCMYCGAKTEAADARKKPAEDKIVLQAGKCPVCGKATEDTDSVCTNCGFPVISIAGSISKKEKDKIIEAVREYRKKMSY